MNLPLSLYGLNSERLVESLSLPEKRYGGQILAWLGKGATTFDEMTDLPLDERKRLSDLVGVDLIGDNGGRMKAERSSSESRSRRKNDRSGPFVDRKDGTPRVSVRWDVRWGAPSARPNVGLV